MAAAASRRRTGGVRAWDAKRFCRTSPLASSAGLASSQKEPIEGHLLLEGEGEQEVRVGSRSRFVAVDVLLEDSQFAGKLTLRTLPSHLCEPSGKVLYETLHF